MDSEIRSFVCHRESKVTLLHSLEKAAVSGLDKTVMNLTQISFDTSFAELGSTAWEISRQNRIFNVRGFADQTFFGSPR